MESYIQKKEKKQLKTYFKYYSTKKPVTKDTQHLFSNQFNLYFKHKNNSDHTTIFKDYLIYW